MTKPMKEEMLKELAFSWGHGGIGSKHDMYLAIRSLIEKYGDGGPKITKNELTIFMNRLLDIWSFYGGERAGAMMVDFLKSKGVVVEEEP